MEVFVLVPRKRGFGLNFATLFFMAAGSIALIATWLWSFMVVPVSIAFYAIGIYFMRKSLEYEYSYFDGDFRFAKIISKSKRKNLRGYEIEEVQIIAPEGDRSVYKYENDGTLKVRDLTSGKNDGKVYTMVAKGDEGLEITKFQPDEKYLDAVCIKYPYKVIR
ncbi:MAG: hypothetical protein IKJ01_01020 [Lachnospiraceae bacterium]|nr:hypothetical protein [Lachnospiraceae bacterium]